MKRNSIAKILALLMLVSVMCLNMPTASAASGDAGARIDAYVKQHEDTLAGLAVSVFGADFVECESYFGFADREAGLAVTEETVFDWGSITKLTVWISAMQLWEQGKLELDADIRAYLPDGFLTRLQFDAPITMIHLMNHQGGFEDSVMGMDTPDKSEILPLEVYLYRYQPAQVYAPGTVTAYSNWSTALAGLIVERLSGMPFYQYVQENLFAPIGITHAALNSDLSDNPWASERRQELRAYSSDGSALSSSFAYCLPYPCGSCVSPLSELRRFAQELLRPDTVWFRSPDTYYEMLSPTSFYGDTGLALNSHGFWTARYYAVPVIGHGGNTGACSSELMLDLENLRGMVVMVNQQTESVFTHLMANEIFGEGEWELPEYSGYLQSARTTYSGLLKCYRIVATYSPAVSEQIIRENFCVRDSSGSVDKLTLCYGDYLVKSSAEVLPMTLLLAWGGCGIAFSALFLLWTGAAALLRRLRRRASYPADRLALSSSALSVAAGVLVLLFATSLLSINMWKIAAYRLWAAAMLLLLCALTALCIIKIVTFRKKKTRRQKLLRVFALLAAAGVAANIAYWEMFMFWTV